MKQMNQRSRTGPHIPTRLRNSIETEETGNKHQHRYSPHDAHHDAQPNMMHEQVIDARDGTAKHLTHTLHIK